MKNVNDSSGKVQLAANGLLDLGRWPAVVGCKLLYRFARLESFGHDGCWNPGSGDHSTAKRDPGIDDDNPGCDEIILAPDEGIKAFTDAARVAVDTTEIVFDNLFHHQLSASGEIQQTPQVFDEQLVIEYGERKLRKRMFAVRSHRFEIFDRGPQPLHWHAMLASEPIDHKSFDQVEKRELILRARDSQNWRESVRAAVR